MPYDEKIDTSVTELLSIRDTTKKKMFGGTCHLIQGNMICGVYKDFLVLRLGDSQAREALKKPHVKPFDITGRAMKGWVMIAPEGFIGEKLGQWLDQAYAFAAALPPK